MDIRIKRLNMLKNQLDQYKTIYADLDASVDPIKAPITNPYPIILPLHSANA